MRFTLGSTAAVVASIVACSGCSQPGPSQAEAAAEPQAVTVKAAGCPTPGPQAGCLTIKSRGVVYDISGSAVDAARGVAVSVTGVEAGATTACGVKLADVAVEYLTLQCAPAPAP